MSEKHRLFLDQMFKVDVAQGLREQGYTHKQFKDHLVILSEKGAKWIHTK